METLPDIFDRSTLIILKTNCLCLQQIENDETH